MVFTRELKVLNGLLSAYSMGWDMLNESWPQVPGEKLRCSAA